MQLRVSWGHYLRRIEAQHIYRMDIIYIKFV